MMNVARQRDPEPIRQRLRLRDNPDVFIVSIPDKDAHQLDFALARIARQIGGRVRVVPFSDTDAYREAVLLASQKIANMSHITNVMANATAFAVSYDIPDGVNGRRKPEKMHIRILQIVR